MSRVANRHVSYNYYTGVGHFNLDQYRNIDHAEIHFYWYYVEGIN